MFQISVARCQIPTNVITNIILHSMTILSMQTPTHSGSHSWRIKFMGFEIKTFAKASKHYARESLEQFPGMFYPTMPDLHFHTCTASL